MTVDLVGYVFGTIFSVIIWEKKRSRARIRSRMTLDLVGYVFGTIFSVIIWKEKIDQELVSVVV